MKLKLSIQEILKATQGKIVRGNDLSSSLRVGVSTDTRTITPDDIFLPLKGPNFDGYDYIDEALKKGCKGYLEADDSLTAYLNIANCARRKVNPVVVAVTGSSGKTTTKEFIYSVLSTTYNTHKSALNHNNEIGLCQTFLAMEEDTRYAVIEMGMRGPGEIELLSKYSEPDIAVITNVGTAHIGRLGSVDNISKAKCEITGHLKESGVLIAHNDELIKKYCAFSGKKIFYPDKYKIIHQEENSTEFSYKGEVYKIPVIGEYNVINAIVAVETGLFVGVSINNIKTGLLNYIPVGDRGIVVEIKDNIKLIVDCYNANPESVRASIDSVVSFYKDSPIVLVLGDMAELGSYEEEMHRKVGDYISGMPVHSLITVGKKAKLIADRVGSNIIKKSFLNNKEAAEYLENNLEKGSVVLFKSSRCMKLEEIVKILSYT